MTPSQLLRTIYLGDRSCKGLAIETWAERVSLHVDVISRIRSESGSWDFYTGEDIPDGRLVFTGVTELIFHPSGPLPNDLINDIEIISTEDTAGQQPFVFVISVGSVDHVGRSKEVTIKICAKGFHIEDPSRPGDPITS